MKKYSEIEALRIIKECAEMYKQFLVNKNFLFIYRQKDGKYNYIETLFKPKHFLHLTGNDKTDELTSIHFYSKCIDNTISLADIRKTKMMDLKLNVLPRLMKIHKNARMLGDFDESSMLKLYTEKLIGNNKSCMGFQFDLTDEFFVPNTILSEDTRSVTLQNNQIIAVYSKPYNDSLYNTLCYVAKKSDIAKLNPKKLLWPKEISEVIDISNLVIDI